MLKLVCICPTHLYYPFSFWFKFNNLFSLGREQLFKQYTDSHLQAIKIGKMRLFVYGFPQCKQMTTKISSTNFL